MGEILDMIRLDRILYFNSKMIGFLQINWRLLWHFKKQVQTFA